jgi:hypothetical protein
MCTQTVTDRTDGATSTDIPHGCESACAGGTNVTCYLYGCESLCLALGTVHTGTFSRERCPSDRINDNVIPETSSTRGKLRNRITLVVDQQIKLYRR